MEDEEQKPEERLQAADGTLSGPVACSERGAPQLGTVTGGQLHSAETVIDEAEHEQLEIDLEAGTRSFC